MRYQHLGKSFLYFSGMPHRLLWFAFLLIGVWSVEIFAQDTLQDNSFTQLVLREKLPQWMDRYNVPGVHVVVLEGGAISQQYTFGWADRDQQIPLQTNHAFPVDNWIKPLVSQLVLAEARRGTINLDLPIHTYLKQKDLLKGTYNPGDVTVKTLLLETDGLAVAPSMEHTVFGLSCRNLSGHVLMQQRPDQKVHMHTVGYALLIQALENVTGTAFEDLLPDLVSSGSRIHWPQIMYQASADSVAQPHTRLQRSFVESIPDSLRQCSLRWRPDGLAQFLLLWQKAEVPTDSLSELLDPNAVLPPEPTESIWQWNGRSYNAGFFIDPTGAADTLLVLPDDGLAGFYHEAYFDPKSGDGLIICTNSQNGRAVIHRLVRAWSRLHQRKIPQRTQSYLELDQVVYLGGFFVLMLSIGIGVRLVLTRQQRSFLISRKLGYLTRLLGWVIIAFGVWLGSSTFLNQWVPHLYEIALVPLWLYVVSTLFWVLFPRREYTQSGFD